MHSGKGGIDGGHHWRLAHSLYLCSMVVTVYTGPYFQVKIDGAILGQKPIVFLMLLVGPGTVCDAGQTLTIVE